MTLISDLKCLFRCLAISFFAVVHINIYAQGTPTIFDCLGAKPICEQTYKETFFPRGEGNFTGEVNPNLSCLLDNSSAVWYTFITDSPGNLGFQISPEDVNSDINWGLFDITDNDCRDIFSTPSMLVSCNSVGGDLCNGMTGIDNSTTVSTQEGICNSLNPDNSSVSTAWNVFVPVEANNIYALMIYDVSGVSSSGFEIDFSLSDDIMLQDNKSPEIKSISPNKGIGCTPNNIWVRFTEYLRCQSISPSNFRLTDEKGRSYLIDLDSGSCNLNGEYDRNYVVTLQEPLPVGNNYLLEITPNMSYPIVDLCGNVFSSYEYRFSTTINELKKINLPPDTSTCENILTLDVTDSNATNYSWSDGSTDATLDVISGGLYFVTVSNSCESVNTSVKVFFMADADKSFWLGRDTILCESNELILDPGISNSTDEYLWADGLSEPIRKVNESGNYILQVTNACGMSTSDSINVEFQNLNIDLGRDTVLCVGEVLMLDATQLNAKSYQWSNGEITPMITVSEGGLYSVEISNDCGSVEDEINIALSECNECEVYVPNVISRAATGDNKYFKILTACNLETYHLRVYNRWGSLVFETRDHLDFWDGSVANGEIQSKGIYAYHLTYTIAGNLVPVQVNGDILLIQ